MLLRLRRGGADSGPYLGGLRPADAPRVTPTRSSITIEVPTCEQTDWLSPNGDVDQGSIPHNCHIIVTQDLHGRGRLEPPIVDFA